MKSKVVLGSLLLSVLFGCANTTTNVAPRIFHDKSKSTDPKVIRVPELGINSTVEIGENMYAKSYFVPKDTYTVKLQSNVKVDNSKDRQYAWLLLGVVGAVIMESTAESNDLVLKQSDSFPLYEWKNSSKRMVCSIENHCVVDMNNQGAFTHKTNHPNGELEKMDSSLEYELIPAPPLFTEDSFKYVALYQGKVGSEIKISFREFLNNTARPAFSQEINYELDNNGETIIGFKGLRIKVVTATNLNITYEIIKDYS